jgi:SAM-dependent methyltransferase
VKIQHADAVDLPFDDETFDAVAATQVLEYVPDLDAAIHEIWRVLKPGGRTLILDTDWDSIVWNNSDHERMQRVLAAWSERMANARLPRSLGASLRAKGFEIQHQTVVNLFNPDHDPNTYSDALINAVVGFVTDRQGVTAHEAESWAADLRQLGAEGRYFFSMSRYLVLATKPAQVIAVA